YERRAWHRWNIDAMPLQPGTGGYSASSPFGNRPCFSCRSSFYPACLACLDIGSLRALWTGLELVLDRLALFEVLESEALNCAVMRKNVSGAIRRFDEAEALFGVEPFYSASSHVYS